MVIIKNFNITYKDKDKPLFVHDSQPNAQRL